jgi:alkaline phosphatase D
MIARPPIAGSYSTNYGVINLQSNGDAVEGTYVHQGGRVSGTLQGSRVTGTWIQSNSVGTFVFDFDPNANGFQGTWQEKTPYTGSGTWNGVRRDLPSQAKGGFPGGWNSLADGPLLAGPMIGEIGERDVRIWIQARSPSPMTLHIDAADGTSFRIVQTPAWSEWLCHVFHVQDLRAGVVYK